MLWQNLTQFLKFISLNRVALFPTHLFLIFQRTSVKGNQNVEFFPNTQVDCVFYPTHILKMEFLLLQKDLKS